MKIGILSDTHGILCEEFKQSLSTCDYLIHAGDINTENCYHELKDLHIPIYMVRGNCDYGDWSQFIPETLSFRIDGLTFYLIHNRSQLPYKMPEADFIIFGHTHQYTTYERLGRTFLNPGSAGQSRGEMLSIVILTIADGTYSIEKITL